MLRLTKLIALFTLVVTAATIVSTYFVVTQ